MRPLRFVFLSKRTSASVLLTASFLIASVVHAAPTISSVSPSSGTTTGGTSATVTGTGFAASLYQRPIAVTNDTGEVLTDMQVTSTIDTSALIDDAKMRSDCGDLRVLDSDASTAIPYWIQDDTCNTTSTTIWIKIPSLPNGGETVYFTYGDSSATTTASGSDVFLFFDDFNGETLNPQWDEVTGSPEVSGGLLSLDSGDGVFASGYSIPSSTVWEASAVRTDASAIGSPLRVAPSALIGNAFHCDTPGCVDVLWWSGNTVYAENGSNETSLGTANTTGTSTAQIIYRPGGLDQIDFSYAGLTYTYTDNNAPLTGTTHPVIYVGSSNGPSYWDWWLIRQYSSIPPQTSVGAETEALIGVTIGGAAATDVSVVNATTLTLTTPARTAGAKDIVVTNPDGSVATSTDAFTYVVPAVTIAQSGGSTAATEGGSTDAYTIVLTTQPTSTVQIFLSADSQLSLSTSTLDFGPTNWDAAKTVTVTAVNDSTYEGSHTGIITHAASSTGTDYPVGLPISNVTVTITDNDSVPADDEEETVFSGNGGLGSSGVGAVAPVTPTFQMVYTINGVVQPFIPVAYLPSLPSLPSQSQPAPAVPATPPVRRVSLVARPFQITRELKPGMRGEDVRQFQRFLNANGFIVAKSGPGSPGKETDLFGAATYQAMLKFKKAYAKDIAAKTPKAVRPAANAVDSPTRAFINDFGVSEDGLRDIYQLVLQSEPTADVTIRIIPDKQLEIVPAIVIFTPANWNKPIDIVVTAVDDKIAETAVHNGVVRHEVVSEDPAYQSFSLSDLKVLVKDNDKAGILLTKPKK